MTPKYNPKIYEEVYDEYEGIFGKEDNLRKVNENVTQNIIENSVITGENNTYTTVVGTSNIEQGNVIGKIIIPFKGGTNKVLRTRSKRNTEI